MPIQLDPKMPQITKFGFWAMEGLYFQTLFGIVACDIYERRNSYFQKRCRLERE